MIRDIDHINIASTDMAATRDFLVDVLGFEDGPRPQLSFPGHWLYAGGRAVVHLQDAVGAVVPSRQSVLNHAAFEVDDIDAIMAELKRRGVSYRERTAPDIALRQIFFDITGVTVELNQRG